ncbi:putative uncharacterized protein [Parachlamydia acanthamoebae UV-7]|jgi:oxalate decarboxylase|uniref:Cupin type-1 domain-containing protein n=2 Tax=Parachlamydia acanthamoebae TaxID=83552 RepID=F8KYV7_PARAV|nr:cupin domain-containing protein [Parachlamydia acanthamoebae]EFB41059.1 hypothetical protein pah_c050o007 [Parachlamydia acanthamoebae str. Hall's coccus]CCB86072.1 putative uncharacterized protein [Parachlamydia acanthamoebae UV-7]
MVTVTSYSHVFPLGSVSPQKSSAGGYRIDARHDNFPALQGMSLSCLILHPKAFREPHWHPNADELSYCIDGKALMTIFSPGAGHDTFSIESGDIVYVPRGYIHHIENIGDQDFKALLCFDHAMPEDLELSKSIQVMPNHILGATCELDAQFFSDIKKAEKSGFIVKEEHVSKDELSYVTNSHKMDLEAAPPQVHAAGGWVKMSNGFFFPELKNLAVYSVCLEQNGAREPHWHPNAAELNCLISGSARITLLSPDGSQETFDMQAGDISFLPRGYLHHIENTGVEQAKFAIFFNHAYPSDIGLSGVLGAYSNDILAALFNVSVSYFDKLPKYQHDLLVVGGGG